MPIYRASPKFEQVSISWQFGICLDTGDTDPAIPGAAINAAVETNLIPVIGIDCQFLGTQVSDPHAKLIAGQMNPSATLPFGTEGNVSLPPVACYHVTLYDGIYGLGRTGGWFMAGVPVDSYDGGQLNDSFVLDAQAAFDAFLANVNGSAGQVCVWSEKDGAAHPVLRLTVAKSIRVQRRREFGKSIGGPWAA